MNRFLRPSGLLIPACLICLGLPGGCAPAPTDQVVVYVAVDRKDAEVILRNFEQETGIRVRAVFDAEAAKTTGLVTRLLAESGRPRCDVFWNNEFVQTMMLAERGLLQPYHSPQAAGVPAGFKDDKGRWTGQAVRARVIVYNTELVPADEAPGSLAELSDPRWRGKVAIANPQFGTTRTHVAALFAAMGPHAGEQLTGLLNNEVRIVDGNAMVKNLVARASPGASPVLVGLTDTDDVCAGQSEDEPVEMVFPDQDELGTLAIPTTVSMIKAGPNEVNARRLIDFLLSPPALQRLTSPGTGYHKIPGAADDEGLAGIRTMEVSFQEILDHLEISTQWTSENFRP